MNRANACMNCGNLLDPATGACRVCGWAPVAAYPPPAYYPPRPASRGFPWWVLILLLILMCILCCCCSLAASAIIASQQFQRIEIPGLPEIPIPPIPEESLPFDLPEMPELPELPFPPDVQLPPLDEPFEPSYSANQLLLDYRDEWTLADLHAYTTDFFQQGAWMIGVKQPGVLVAAMPPPQPEAWQSNYAVSVDISVNSPFDTAGILCQVQDENNYYQVSFRNDQYAVAKVLNGELIPLTDPYWQTSQFIPPGGLMAGASVSVACMGSGIGVSVEGLGEAPMISDPDDSFTSGAVAVFAQGEDQVTGLYYSLAEFKNFMVESMQ